MGTPATAQRRVLPRVASGATRGTPAHTARRAHRVSGGWPVERARISYAPKGIVQSLSGWSARLISRISCSSYGRSQPVVKRPYWWKS